MGQAKRRKEAGDPTFNLPKRQKRRSRRVTVEDFDYVMPMFAALMMASKRSRLRR